MDLVGFCVGCVLLLFIIIICLCPSNREKFTLPAHQQTGEDNFERTKCMVQKANVERNVFTPHGYHVPFYDRRPRIWVTSPGAYGSVYSEQMLTCLDSCAGREDRQDCYVHCKKMYPYTWDWPVQLSGFENASMVI